MVGADRIGVMGSGRTGPPVGWLLTAFLLAAVPLGARPEGSVPTERRAGVRALERIRFEHLTNRDGLSQMSVQTILQDRQGFMWFGTEDGLNRYDGYELRVFRPDAEKHESVSMGSISVLLEDSSGLLWIGTSGGGLDRFDPARESFRHYRHDPEQAATPGSLSHDDVRAIHEDGSGALWIGTGGGGLDRFDPARDRFTHYRHDPNDPHSLSHDVVQTIHEDGSGVLWVGTQGGGLDRFDPARDRFVHYRHDPQTAAGDPGSLSHDDVRALHEDSSGVLWIGTWGGGLDRFDRSRGHFVHHRHDPDDPGSLSHDRVRALHEDSSGVLWIGTWGGGLDRLDPSRKRFVHTRHDPEDAGSLSHDRVSAIAEDRSGILWIGTLGGGVNFFDPSRDHFIHYRHDPGDPESLSHDVVLAIHEDRSGSLWVGTEGGFDRMERDREGLFRERFTHLHRDPGDPHGPLTGRVSAAGHDAVLSLWEDRSGDLWVGTPRGLERLDGDRRVSARYRHDPRDPCSLSHDVVLAVLDDRSGNLWVGTAGGLNRLGQRSPRRRATESPPRTETGAACFFRYRHRPEEPWSLSHDLVRAIHEDRAGNLWVGTRAGLNRLDRSQQQRDGRQPSGPRGHFVRYQHQPEDPESLGHDVVLSIHEDRTGSLWIGTFGGGLDRFDPTAESFTHLTEADGLPNNVVYGILEDDLGRLWLSTNRGLTRFDPQTRKCTSYDARDGLQDDEFNAGAFHRGGGGRMYFGGVHGFNAFRPERFHDNPYLPPIVLTSFRIFESEAGLGRALSGLERIELSHRQNFFSFELAALSFARSDKNRYAYMLEGFDEAWVESGSRRYASYTNVPPGKYLFRAKGSNNDGLWNERGAAVEILVRPPLWRTWWAYLAYVLGLSSVAAAYLRSQRRKLERERAIAGRERAMSRDLRELAGLKDELLADRAAELGERQRLIAKLEAKNDELERFTYTVSHDLKSPLLTIHGFLGFLERDVQNDDAERVAGDVERIKGAASQMQHLIDDLLELSRIGRKAGRLEDVALAELAAEVRELLAGQIAERGAEVAIAPGLPVVRGDRVRLRQLLQNLLQNALQYLGDQPAPQIEVGTRPGEADRPGVLFVRDNGAGIDPEHQEKIFELFQRLDSGTAGTGVGLALVKRIVEVHGGRIWVESEGPGRGSTFCFTLPGSASSLETRQRACSR